MRDPEIPKSTETTPRTLTPASPMVTTPQRCDFAWNYGSKSSGVPVSAVHSTSHIPILAPTRVAMLTDVLIGSRPCRTP